jgi:transcriptional regulator with XRE-family HTH domain
MEDAGQKLKQIRERLGLTYRDVEEFSARIAAVRRNDEFNVALSRLADIENRKTLPTFYRLYTLCAIYRLDMIEVLDWYGVALATVPADAALLSLPKTHKVGFKFDEGEAQLPIALDPGFDSTRTVFLSRFIQKWGRLPLMLLNHTDLRNLSYGLIGTEDWSMFPILSPGALVVIDQGRRRIFNSGWNSEFERPIYFFEHREGYACGWCTLRENQLTVQFHASSLRDPEIYQHPKEIEVIGQVTGAAVTLDPVLRRRPHDLGH